MCRLEFGLDVVVSKGLGVDRQSGVPGRAGRTDVRAFLELTEPLLYDLYVVPGCRDEGVGSRLLTAAETALVDRGAEVVAVQALAPNAAARRLYERHGYAVHRVEMERALADGNDTDTSDG